MPLTFPVKSCPLSTVFRATDQHHLILTRAVQRMTAASSDMRDCLSQGRVIGTTPNMHVLHTSSITAVHCTTHIQHHCCTLYYTHPASLLYTVLHTSSITAVHCTTHIQHHCCTLYYTHPASLLYTVAVDIYVYTWHVFVIYFYQLYTERFIPHSLLCKMQVFKL